MPILPRGPLACGLPCIQTPTVGKRIGTLRNRRHPQGTSCTVSHSESVYNSVRARIKNGHKNPRISNQSSCKITKPVTNKGRIRPPLQTPPTPSFTTYNRFNVLEEESGESQEDLPTQMKQPKLKKTRRFNEHLGNALRTPPEETKHTPHHLWPLPRIQVAINGKSTIALIDSGSTHNFIKSSLVNKYAPSDLAKVTLAEEGSQMHILGSCYLHVTVNNTHSRATFHVTENLNHDVILGCPWLRDQDVHLDFSRHTAHLGTKQRTTVHWQQPPHGNKTTPKIPDTPRNGFPQHLQHHFTNMVATFPEILSPKTEITTTKTITHRINVTTNVPFSIRPYPYPSHKKQIILQQVDEMLADGVIEPSNSPYTSPIVIVKKKDGTSRFCVDYRRLNTITQTESCTMPAIPEALRDLGAAQVFSTLDLRAGYWQIPLDNNSKQYTAFATPDGATYQFKVMPFGLKNAPGTFQRLMTQEVLVGFLHKFAIVYLDDIVVYSNSWEEHLHHLTLVFERLQQHGLRCSPEKCRFATHEIEYLGHKISTTHNSPQPLQQSRIALAKPPHTKRQLRQFLGLCGWLREFVPNFSHLIIPLTTLLSNKQNFKWGPSQEQAFQAIKTALSQPLSLHRPDMKFPFVLQTDASSIGISAVLYQEIQKERHIISYSSAKLTPTQQKYHINEQECLAIVTAIKRYRPYLEDQPFTLRTDNAALQWLHTMKDTRAKLTRWALLLQEFDFTIEHCQGRDNELADLLSRTPEDVTAEDPETDRLLPPYHAYLTTISPEELVEQVKASQRARTTQFQRLIDRLYDVENETRQQEWTVVDGYFYHLENDNRQLVAPEDVQRTIINAFHDHTSAGHPGAEETERAIRQRYYWPTMHEDISKYVRRCLPCARCKTNIKIPHAGLKPHVPEHPWDSVSIDIMGPYPQTPNGNRFLFVVTDLFTRWVEAFPLKITDSKTITDILEQQIFSRYGYPKTIFSDNGPQFASRHFIRTCRTWGCHHWSTANYHPRANPVERRNQEIKKGLRLHFLRQPRRDWEQYLPPILFNLRSRLNHATNTTPSSALLGYEIRRPGDQGLPLTTAHTRVDDRPGQRNRIKHFQRQYQARYAEEDEQQPLQPGQRVLIRNLTQTPGDAFHTSWDGPMEIISREGHNTYIISRDNGTRTKIHRDNIRLAPDGNPDETIPHQTPTEPQPGPSHRAEHQQLASDEFLRALDSEEDSPAPDALQ